MNNTNWITAILVDLELQVVSNYKIVAKKYKIVYIILIR